jgi:hypothetical protein
MAKTSVTEEYQDGENSYCEFFGLVPFLQLAIQGSISEISGSHGSEYEDDYLLGCCAVYSGRRLPTFQRCLLPRLDDGGSKHL